MRVDKACRHIIKVGIVSYVALLQALIAEKVWLAIASLDPLLITTVSAWHGL